MDTARDIAVAGIVGIPCVWGIVHEQTLFALVMVTGLILYILLGHEGGAP